MAPSFYTLELYVGPGGSRFSYVLVLRELDEVKRAYASFFADFDVEYYHLLWYSLTATLKVYQTGTLEQTFDLLEITHLTLPGFRPWRDADATSDDEDELERFLTREDGERIPLDDLLAEVDDDFSALTSGATLHVAWEDLDLRPLEPPLLEPGEGVGIETDYIAGEPGEAQYGIYETEHSFSSATLDWDNLWDFNEWEEHDAD